VSFSGEYHALGSAVQRLYQSGISAVGGKRAEKPS
jgi:hypothetical protein